MSWVLSVIRRIAEGIIITVIGGYILFQLVGVQLSELLESYYPNLPLFLFASLILAFVGYCLFSLYKSVRYRRGLESKMSDLWSFLQDWDRLGVAFRVVMRTNSDDDLREFEGTRSKLLYNYPRISALVRTMRYDYYDPAIGISVKNYDLIGNFLSASPFASSRGFRGSFIFNEWTENWDRGRTFLVFLLGRIDINRNTVRHRLLQCARATLRLGRTYTKRFQPRYSYM